MSNNKQDIEELRERFETLREQRTTAQADLRNVEEQLAKLKAQALEKYGTDDLGELRKKLDEMRTENERKRTEYQAHLDGIDKQLADLEAADD
ncbi:MAG: hypothetical protein JJU11_11135 [Candidatus Sumerlaeia bacterium]|nr:hypothetical protein [Candidatus Sumerlaeia bacterium]